MLKLAYLSSTNGCTIKIDQAEAIWILSLFKWYQNIGKDIRKSKLKSAPSDKITKNNFASLAIFWHSF